MTAADEEPISAIDSVADIVIPARFNGPPGSANGGYACGTVAGLVGGGEGDGGGGGGPVEVRLRRPPPLDRPLTWDGSRLLDGDVVVAEGSPAGDTGPPAGMPAPVSLDEAAAASRRYPGFADHPYPTCFGCGPQRAEGDGLRVFAGPVTGREPYTVASPWLPRASVVEGGEVPVPVVWAAPPCLPRFL